MVQMNLQSPGMMSVQSDQLPWLGQMPSSDKPAEHMPLGSNTRVVHANVGNQADESAVMENFKPTRQLQVSCENEGVTELHLDDSAKNLAKCGSVDDPVKIVPEAEPPVVDLRQWTSGELMKFAEECQATHHTLNPFEDVWGGGLLDKVCLPPGRESVLPFTMGGDPMCAKAWRSIAGCGVQSYGRFDGEPSAGEMGGMAQYVPTVGIEGLPEEYRHFVCALEQFLQERVTIPIISSTSDVLNLEKLFKEVTQMGGYGVLSMSKWASIAQRLQGNSELGKCLQQVYLYYLSPLEDSMPSTIPASEAQSWMMRWVTKQSALRSAIQSVGGEVPTSSNKRMKLSNDGLEVESLKIIHSLARDPLGAELPSRLVTATMSDDISQKNYQEYETSRRRPAECLSQHNCLHGEVPWLLMCSYSNSLRTSPGFGRIAPVLKPPVPLPIQLPFSLLASAGLTQKNTGKKTWLADSSGKRIVTPKCGTCRTCMKPQLKKACVTNRERLAKGMEPLVNKPAPKFN